MRGSFALENTLRAAISSFLPRCVIETGTHTGTGSTRMILRAFGERTPEKFLTIEVSRELVNRARVNLADAPSVECLWGLSVRREAAHRFLLGDEWLRELDPALDIYVDFLPDPVAGYTAELAGALGGDQDNTPPDNLLELLLNQFNSERPFICLDSAGGIGWLEFHEVLRLQRDLPFLILLDDINHVKHYRSARYIERSPAFEVLGADHDEGWMIAVRA